MSTSKEIVGSWRLVACEHRRTDGGATEHPFGPKPEGRLVYLASGFMSVVLVDPARRKFGSSQLFEGSDAEFADAARGCVAYTGRWGLRDGKVLHEVEASLFPNWIGTTLVRSCDLVGDRLNLATAGFAIRGVEYTALMVWEREAE